LIAFPFNAVINWPMATPAGVALFTHHKVNAMLKKMFDVWAVFLTGKKSRYVLNKDTGWLCPDALATLKVPAYDDPQTSIDFETAFVCTPSNEHYGFRSWDDFFVRDFATGIRPVEGLDDDSVIVSACESIASPIMFSKWTRSGLKGNPTLSIICWTVILITGNPSKAVPSSRLSLARTVTTAGTLPCQGLSKRSFSFPELIMPPVLPLTAIQRRPINPSHTSPNLRLAF
jgi:hypothetical protein